MLVLFQLLPVHGETEAALIFTPTFGNKPRLVFSRFSCCSSASPEGLETSSASMNPNVHAYELNEEAPHTPIMLSLQLRVFLIINFANIITV